MKRFILFFSLIIMCATLNAQDRVNRPKLKYLTQGAKLTNFKGWRYDSEVGEWIGYTNVILYDKSRLEDMRVAPTWTKSTSENIISLQFKTIIVDSVKYYVLVWELWTGSYRYPTIQVDWEEYRTKRFLLFTEDEMNKLHNVGNDPICVNAIEFERGEFESHISEVDIIYKRLNGYDEYGFKCKDYEVTINGKKYIRNDAKSKICFEIYKSTDNKIRFNVSGDIAEEYFEITYEYFKTLINIRFPKQ